MSTGYGLTLNTGSYFGSGYSGTNPYCAKSSYGNRVASSTNLTRVSRDLAQGYSEDIDIMNDCFEEGNVKEALRMYKELFEDAKQTAENYGYDLTDSQIRSSINTAFQNRTGTSLTGQASLNTHSSFVTGLLEGVPVVGWLFAEPNSSADARATIRGKAAPSFGEIAKETAGAAVSSTAAIGALAGLSTVVSASGVTGGILAGAAGLCAAGALPVVGAGLAIGAAVVGVKHLISKV